MHLSRIFVRVRSHNKEKTVAIANFLPGDKTFSCLNCVYFALQNLKNCFEGQEN